MNLLHVVHYPVFGGPHNQALRLAEPLARRGWHATVLLPEEPGNAAERLRGAGIEVVAMPLHRLRATRSIGSQARFGLGFPGDVVRIRRLIREREIDLVVVCGLVNPHAAIAAHLEGVSLVWQLVDTRAPMAMRRLLVPLVRRLADAVMFDGRALMPAHGWGPKETAPSVVYYPPVDTQRLRPSEERRLRTRAILGVSPDAPVVGMVANLNPQKGIEYFVRAARVIGEAQPETTFLLVGAEYGTHGAYAQRIRDEVGATGIPSERFIFAGGQAQIADWYPAMDVKLITSVPRSEGTTTTAMEAMACGIPVVATDVGAVREVVEDGLTGFVVPPLDVEAIATATIRLLEDPQLRARMGETARQRAVERYDVETCADVHVRAFEAALARRRMASAASFDAPLSNRARTDGDEGAGALQALLVCPACRSALDWQADAATCGACRREYPVEDGVPVLLADRSMAAHDEIEHLLDRPDSQSGLAHKASQAEFFDRDDAEEFETARPHGTPWLYRFLIGEKLNRSVRGFSEPVSGKTALVVCGGSGMDGEFLVRAGTRVITSDISLGAARRAKARAERYGLNLLPVVADVERLPFADQSMDLVTVHDGLHHLNDPIVGVREMSRVARTGVSITEPAAARATRVAVRLGWALEHEEAGNRVARLDPRVLTEELRLAGFAVAYCERYAMWYPHVPGRSFRLLSSPAARPLIRAGWPVLNCLVGRWGNKLTVQAIRRVPDS